MTAGIKRAAASIIADFCEPLTNEANETVTIAMAQEVITSLAISKIRTDMEKSIPFANGYVNHTGSDPTKLELTGIWVNLTQINF